MGKVIHKHVIIPHCSYYSLPRNAEILSVKEQRGDIVLYEMHDTDYYKADTSIAYETRDIRIIPTGLEFDAGLIKQFLGTVSLDNGEIMLHVFEFEY